MLSGHMVLVASILASEDMEHFHYHRMFCWATLACLVKIKEAGLCKLPDYMVIDTPD